MTYGTVVTTQTKSIDIIAVLFVLHINYKRENRRASRALFFRFGLRQAKVVHTDPCLTYNFSMIKNRWLHNILMTVSELAELLTPIGCIPLASRTPIKNGAP